MKKGAMQILLATTLLFVGFTMGFLLGRNTGHEQLRVTCPTVAETPTDTVPSQPVLTFLLNINTATKEELDTLPSIGPVIAQRIVDYRNENGPFTNISQLMRVEGIGADRFEKLADRITVGG